MTTRNIRLSQGFSAGNYANAYETQDFETAYENRDLDGSGPEYKAAFILGFFANYELHEIPADSREIFDEAYHSDLGQAVLSLGYCDPRKEDYDKEAMQA